MFQLFLADSSLTLRGHGDPKVLSLYVIPGASEAQHTDPFIRLGFPKLPQAGSKTNFKVLREWLRICNDTHECHRRPQKFLPTRVLDVMGRKNSDSVRLFCVSRCQGATTPDEYIALSHRWGDPKQHRKFCTTRSNLSSFEKSIKYDQLPRTFQDAITVTRGLGVRFLWIDSLCIVQDDPDDWEKESKRMEAVFSSAYCTIAATCASGSADGFLKNRRERDYVTKRSNRHPELYICQAIDNFQADVEDSELNQRGWVLQERVLSSRTIYYTQNQCYWECGKGIRCETLTMMKKYVQFTSINAPPLLNLLHSHLHSDQQHPGTLLILRSLKASFLGDAHFPKSAAQFYKGGRIRVYEVLYERYSKLVFSFVEDRPVAISGLEERLLNTFNTVGGYGIFECYFHRGLLWHRSGDSMKRIKSLRNPAVPSWSWMGYDGGIKYMDIPASQADWNSEIRSPFFSKHRNASGKYVDASNGPRATEVRAVGRKFSQDEAQHLIFDDPNRRYKDLRCVVVGKEKETAGKIATRQKYYVLIVVENDRVDGWRICERVAVGYMEGWHIRLEGHGDPVVIR